MSSHAPKRATIADLIEAERRGQRFEILAGELVEKEAAGFRHGARHDGILGTLRPPFRGRGGDGRPGGWVFIIEPSILAPNGDVVLPDIAGWHLDRVPPDDVFPVEVAPDWICEIMWSSHKRDEGYKPDTYRELGVPHMWLLDAKSDTLSVYRRTVEGYVLVTTIDPDSGEVRLAPFDGVPLDARALFGLDGR